MLILIFVTECYSVTELFYSATFCIKLEVFCVSCYRNVSHRYVVLVVILEVAVVLVILLYATDMLC